MARDYLDHCPCGSAKPAEAVYDGYNIFMCYVCEDCRKRKLSKFRKDIFDQYDAEEPIDDDY